MKDLGLIVFKDDEFLWNQNYSFSISCIKYLYLHIFCVGQSKRFMKNAKLSQATVSAGVGVC